MATSVELDLDSEVGVEMWLRAYGYHNLKCEGNELLLDRLRAQGCQTLRDLTFLQDREDVDDFMVDLKMRPMHQNKFRRQVLLLVDRVRDGGFATTTMPDIVPQAAEVQEEPEAPEEYSEPAPEVSRSKQMNRAEDQAVSRLTSAIKTHTVAIQKLEPNVGEVQNEAQALRRELEEKFEEIRSAFETAKAQLVKNLTLAESDAVNKVQTELTSVKQSAGKLLQCHQQVTAPLSEAVDDEERRQRSQFVVSTIAEALGEAPSSMYEHHLLFQTEEVNFQELFANYGKIIINRRKIRASAATE